MDLMLNVDRAPAPGETVLSNGGVAYIPGGKGANAALAFSKLGAHSVFCTKLGADVHGQQLFRYYKDCGIDTSFIKVDRDNPTGFAAIVKESSGQNRIILYPGANEKLGTDNLLDAFSSEPDALFINFEISFQTALSAAKLAASRAIPIFLDAAPADKTMPLEELPYLEVFSPNETETFELCGIMPAGADSSLRAAIALFRRVSCKYVVIKQGARGACIYDGKHFDMIPAAHVQKVVDTTAAGDTFTAALALEYLRCSDIKASAKYAAAAAAVAVSRFGASSSIPSEQEVNAFIEMQ
jgi:ribokinase